jgi:hypothetical protein
MCDNLAYDHKLGDTEVSYVHLFFRNQVVSTLI